MASIRLSIVVSGLFTLCGGPEFVLVYLPWTMTRFRVSTQQPVAQSMAQ